MDAWSRLLSDEIQTVYVGITDLVGQLIGKRCAKSYFLQHAQGGLKLCDLMLAQDIAMKEVPGALLAGAATGYRDILMRPDDEAAIFPPARPSTALVLADCCYEDGAPVSFAPRTILRDQLRRLADKGLALNAASEIEFYVFDGDLKEATSKGARPAHPLTRYDADGHVTQLSYYERYWADIEQNLSAIGAPIDYIKFEGGQGQAEIVLKHQPAARMADLHVLYKQVLRDVSSDHGKSVTFMAKPFGDQAGSSGHIHYSLYDLETGETAMPGAGRASLSDVAESFLAGQLALTRDIAFFLAPTVNSYKRFAPNQLAPVQVNWGEDDRRAAFRIVGRGSSRRVECRIPGADTNPYLAYAGLVAAGLRGVEAKLKLDDVAAGARLPRTLREAGELFGRSEPVKEAFGDDVVDHLARYIDFEASSHEAAVTDWEIMRYMERI